MTRTAECTMLRAHTAGRYPASPLLPTLIGRSVSVEGKTNRTLGRHYPLTTGNQPPTSDHSAPANNRHPRMRRYSSSMNRETFDPSSPRIIGIELIGTAMRKIRMTPFCGNRGSLP